MRPKKENTGNIECDPETPYQIGYRRPPCEYQFKPGQSGNPNGRPRGSRNKRKIGIAAIYAEMEAKLRRESRKTQQEQLDAAGLSKYGIKPKLRK